jgi:hypothetical protein
MILRSFVYDLTVLYMYLMLLKPKHQLIANPCSIPGTIQHTIRHVYIVHS